MTRITALCIALLFISASAESQARISTFSTTSPSKIPVLFDKVYVPSGFDSNDNVQIVGEGMFQHTCYRHAKTTVQVNRQLRTIYLSPVAYKYSGLCMQMVLPYQRVVDIGLLDAGKWTIVQGPDEKKIGEINVTKAVNPEADDYLYAPVTQAFFQQTGAASEVTLSGEFRNSCMKLDQMKVTNEPDVIVIQPIAKLEALSGCVDGSFPFSVVVPVTAPAGRYLLHVRAMGGNALNSLMDVK